MIKKMAMFQLVLSGILLFFAFETFQNKDYAMFFLNLILSIANLVSGFHKLEGK